MPRGPIKLAIWNGLSLALQPCMRMSILDAGSIRPCLGCWHVKFLLFRSMTSIFDFGRFRQTCRAASTNTRFDMDIHHANWRVHSWRK